jgi:hypothetical protein
MQYLFVYAIHIFMYIGFPIGLFTAFTYIIGMTPIVFIDCLCLFLYVGFLGTLIYVLSRYEMCIDELIRENLSVGRTAQQLCYIVNTPRFYEKKRPTMTKRMMNDKLYGMMSKKQVAKTNHSRPIWIKIP